MRRPSLLLLLGFAALLPLVILATGLGWAVLQEQQAKLRADAFEQVDSVTEIVQGALQGELKVLQAMAAAPVLDEPVDTTGFRAFADRIRKREPILRSIGLYTIEGARVLNSPRLASPASALEPRSPAARVASQRPMVGSVRVGPHGTAAFALRVPVLRDGKLIYVLSGVVQARSVDALLRTAPLPPGWVALVADSQANVVARTVSPPPVGVKLSAQAQYARSRSLRDFYHGVTPAGAPVAGVFRIIPAWGWSVHVTLPMAAYVAPIRQSIWILGSGSVAAVLVACAALVFLMREIQARRREAVALETAKRMEVLGRLTGGVAHDFNNILMVIQGGAEAIGRRLKDTDKAASFLSMIMASCERGQSLTHQLLAFARRGPNAPMAFDFARRASDIELLVRQAAGSKVRTRLRPAHDLWPIFADPSALEVALTNLALNARDAMPGGGELEINAYNQNLAQSDQRLAGLVGDFVVVSVRDSGGGIAAEHLPHIFDPFFTTKPVGKGTGLGLSQVFGFAKQSGGAVLVESLPGQGTRFDIYLPRAADAAEPSVAFQVPPLARGRILVVEDNVEVAQVIEDGLTQAGFEIVCCSRAAAALALIEGGDPFDLVLSDVTMEGAMSGLELTQALRRSRPNLPVVLMTGYSERVSEAEMTGAVVISKPFSPRELVDVLRREIGRSRPNVVDFRPKSHET
ncbi:MAG TPA: ATP-binding protein [Beijerinckiaceae bacterium]|nr:ATP-binding protein [Beijerinckiaceae bacterium]